MGSNSEMHAAVLNRPNKLELKNVNLPEISPNEVLIQVAYCGICGTDLHAYEGSFPLGKLPIIMGHEFSGKISKIGLNITNLQVGQNVTVDINIGCGTCFHCLRCEKLLCSQMQQIGLSQDGAFAEFVKVPFQNVRPLPYNVSLLHGAYVEPLSCAIHGQEEAHVQLGQSVLIIGAGPMGLTHIILSRLRGGSPIIVSETNNARREKAYMAGADIVVDPSKYDLAETVYNKTKGIGADVVIEAVGSIETYSQAIKSLRKGGKLVVFGAAPEKDLLQISPYEIFSKELKIGGVIAASYHYWDQAISLLENKRFDPDIIISEIKPLQELESAYKTLINDKSTTKIIIQINDFS